MAANDNMLEVEVAGGKYKVIQNKNGELGALRHGAIWRDLLGDNLVLALAQELDEARKTIQKIHNCVVAAPIEPNKQELLNTIFDYCEEHEKKRSGT